MDTECPHRDPRGTTPCLRAPLPAVEGRRAPSRRQRRMSGYASEETEEVSGKKVTKGGNHTPIRALRRMFHHILLFLPWLTVMPTPIIAPVRVWGMYKGAMDLESRLGYSFLPETLCPAGPVEDVLATFTDSVRYVIRCAPRRCPRRVAAVPFRPIGLL